MEMLAYIPRVIRVERASTRRKRSLDSARTLCSSRNGALQLYQ